MPKCSKCGKVKPESLFYKRANGKLFGVCKECIRKYQMDYYLKHKQQYLNQAKKDQKRYRKERPKVYAAVDKARKYPIAKKCEFCGRTKNLQRHHPDYNYPEIFVTCCKECHIWIEQDIKGNVIWFGGKWVFRIPKESKIQQ